MLLYKIDNMAKSGWYVVKFINEKNVIEIIPNNWIVNFEKCNWQQNLDTLNCKQQSKID